MPDPGRSTDAAVAIEARGLQKAFRIPTQRMDSFKERALHPLTRVEYRELHALRGVSFDVHRGEFFGIVGENGSGKSTLLKLLASIYGADAGSVRIAGRLAPFIELGVGFNPDLTAPDNVVLNGVLMGLSKREARARLEAVLDFAELRDFRELRLKNYSSGMLVRLAFAVMVQADADVMLIDEVLAVGDAAFAQRCMDVFHERHRVGKTIVLVTHDMGTVQDLCQRAMLLHEGELRYIGDPEETASRYFRLNFQDGGAGEGLEAVPDINAHALEARLEDPSGQSVQNVEQGVPIVLDALLEVRKQLVEPRFRLQVLNAEGTLVFVLAGDLTDQERVEEGQRVRIRAEIENRLVPGRYFVDCWVRRAHHVADQAVQGIRLLDFAVFGTEGGDGVVTARAELSAVVE